MLNEHTLTRLRALKLDGMARAFEETLTQPAATSLSFEERFSMLVDREVSYRDARRITRLLKHAELKVSAACLEDVNYASGRGLDKRLLGTLATCDWIRSAHNVLITGLTGVGKTWLGCALGNAACRQGFAVRYVRLPRLLEELHIAHGDGSFARRLAAIAHTDVLLIDDWGVSPLSQPERADLLEVMDDRVGTRSSVITSQLAVKHWHEYLNDPTLADAILDRIVHNSHRIALQGESLRKPEATKKP